MMSSPESSNPINPDEQMVDARGQEQTILPVQTLLIRGISPGFAVAGQEVIYSLNSRDPTARLNLHDTLLEKALATPRPDKCFPVSFINGGIGFDLLFEPTLPDIEIVARHDSAILKRNAFNFRVADIRESIPGLLGWRRTGDGYRKAFHD